MIKTSFDFETYSECDIRTHGAYRYAQHPSTRVICMAYAYGNEEPKLVVPKKDTAPDFLSYDPKKEYGYTLHAWNSFFEWCIWKYVLKLPIPPFEYWHDTMAKAAAMALPLALGFCSKALGLPEDQQKHSRGMFLINKLSKPQQHRSGPKKGEFFRSHDPVLLAEMYSYCVQDVKTEMSVDRKVLPLNKTERQVWIMDQEINARGIYVDLPFVKNAIKIIDTVTARMNARVSEATLGKVPDANKLKQIKAFLSDIGINMPCMDKNAVTAMLATELPPEVRMVLTARQQVGKTSLAKYRVLERLVADDARVHGLLQIYAASTGRWGGRMFQPQNLQRPSFDDTEACIEIINSGDIDYLSMMYEDPMEALASCTRGALIPGEGKKFYGGDYSSIEARGLAWMAEQNDKIEVFKTHGLIYEHTASNIYKVPMEEVTKTQRFIGKVSELALGYQGGGNAFVAMASAYDTRKFDVNITKGFGEKIKKQWRKSNREITALWPATEKAGVYAVKNPGTPFSVRRMKAAMIADVEYFDYDGPVNPVGDVQYVMKGGFLFARLPSGRYLSYYRPHLKPKTIRLFKMNDVVDGENIEVNVMYRQEDWGDTPTESVTNFKAEAARHGADIISFTVDELRFYATNSKTRQWARQHTYGGKLVENNTQAICRDVMAEAMLRARAGKYDIVLTVHDEIITESDNGSKEMFQELMEHTPEWATGFPIQVDAFEAIRYGKF